MTRFRKIAAALIGLASVAAATGPAAAKPARCFASDDGYFQCDFRVIDRRGSFEIEGPDATYTLLIDTPGFATGFVNVGTRNISLPGQYVRQSDDPACWNNPETNTKICAW